MDTEAFLESRVVGDTLKLSAAGSWTVGQAQRLEQLVNSAAAAIAAGKGVVIDISAVRDLDTFGAWLLERLARQPNAVGHARIVGTAARHRGLLDEVAQVNRLEPRGRLEQGALSARLESLYRRVGASGTDLVSLIAMVGALAGAFAHAVRRPRTFRLTSSVHQLDRVGWQAVPIITLITFLIGCIIAQQGIFHFRRFGAEDFVVDLVGILVLREMGVLIVAIMVAGRSGSSYTAELGSMKMREEVDALRTMGLDPVEVLILPRALALVCALPLLAFIGSLAALCGGGLVAWLYAGMSPAIFIARLQEAISLTHFAVGMVKAPFMALVIAAVACSEGMKVKGSAESLGLQTTASVVRAIFFVIVLDGMFAMFFASIGM